MQLLIFFSISQQRNASKKHLRLIDSLNIITFTKNIVKRFFQTFSIFFDFFHFFHKSAFLYPFYGKLSSNYACIYIICRALYNCAPKKTGCSPVFIFFILFFYRQPPHVLQFPVHFFIVFPVEEYISPE